MSEINIATDQEVEWAVQVLRKYPLPDVIRALEKAEQAAQAAQSEEAAK